MFGILKKLFGPSFVAALCRKATAARMRGNAGEDEAVRFLRRKGYKILCRNFRRGRYELDIVCLDEIGGTLVFVEVKTRSENAVVDGYYSALSPSKKGALLKAAKAYMACLKTKPAFWRFDVLDVRMDAENRARVAFHAENILL